MGGIMELEWFAVMTEPRLEERAEWHLRQKGYSTLYLHYTDWVKTSRGRSRLVKKPYMSRYIFCGLGPEHHVGHCPNLYPVNEAIGVSTVVFAPGGVAFPIPAEAMQELMSRADRSGMIYGGKRRRRFSGAPGDKVVLAETSPYWNFMCEIHSIDSSDRIMILLESFGRKVPTLIRPEDVREIHTKSGEIIPKGDPRMCKLA